MERQGSDPVDAIGTPSPVAGSGLASGRVLFVGEEPVRAAPSLTWARTIERYGVSADFVPFDVLRDTRAWLARVRHARSLVLQWYDAMPAFLLRQLALAVLNGVPIVRKWSGTDVHNCLASEADLASARRVQRLVSFGAATGERQAAELASLGIDVVRVPPPLEPAADLAPDHPLGSAVLAYLPVGRRDFYRADLVEEAICAFPDVPFLILADDAHSLAHYPNVESLGWVGDMAPVWRRTGLLLRITRHDGTPRMVLEALQRGCYVVHNHPVPGCWMAEDFESLSMAIGRFRQVSPRNAEGSAYIRRLQVEEGGAVLTRLLVNARVGTGNRVAALGVLSRAAFLRAVSKRILEGS